MAIFQWIFVLAAFAGSALAALVDVSLEDIVHSNIFHAKTGIGYGLEQVRPEDFVAMRSNGASMFEDQYVDFCQSLEGRADLEQVRTEWSQKSGSDVLFSQIVDGNCLWFGALKGMSRADIEQLPIAPFHLALVEGDWVAGMYGSHGLGIDVSFEQWLAALRRTVSLGHYDSNDFFVSTDFFRTYFFQHFQANTDWRSADWDILGPYSSSDLFRGAQQKEDLLKLMTSASYLPQASALTSPLSAQDEGILIKRILMRWMILKSYINEDPARAAEKQQAYTMWKQSMRHLVPSSQPVLHRIIHEIRPMGGGLLELMQDVFSMLTDPVKDRRERLALATWVVPNPLEFRLARFDQLMPGYRAWLGQVALTEPVPVAALDANAEIPLSYFFHKRRYLGNFVWKHRHSFFARVVARRKFYTGHYTFIDQVAIFEQFPFGKQCKISDLNSTIAFPDRQFMSMLRDQGFPFQLVMVAYQFGYQLVFPSEQILEQKATELLNWAVDDISTRWEPIIGTGDFRPGASDVTVEDVKDMLRFLSVDGNLQRSVKLPPTLATRIDNCVHLRFSARSDPELQAMSKESLEEIMRKNANFFAALHPPLVEKLKNDLASLPKPQAGIVAAKYTDEKDYFALFPGLTPLNVITQWHERAYDTALNRNSNSSNSNSLPNNSNTNSNTDNSINTPTDNTPDNNDPTKTLGSNDSTKTPVDPIKDSGHNLPRNDNDNSQRRPQHHDDDKDDGKNDQSEVPALQSEGSGLHPGIIAVIVVVVFGAVAGGGLAYYYLVLVPKRRARLN
jgi:hypothetical protein